MKLLLDENIPMDIKKFFLDNGYDIEHVCQKMRGKKDSEVFEYAVKNQRCLVTYDCDYDQMKEKHHYGIIKVEQVRANHQVILFNVVEKFKEAGLEDIYIHITKNKVVKYEKKYSKKGEFKQFHKMPIEI